MQTVFSFWAKLVVKNRWLVMISMFLITFALAYGAKNLTVVIDIDKIMPQNHPYIQGGNDIERIFGTKFVTIISVTPKEGDAFQAPVLARVKSITDKIAQLEFVNKQNLLSLTARKAKDIRGTADGFEVHPMVEGAMDTPEALDHLRQAVAQAPIFHNTLVSGDTRSTSIVVEMKQHPAGFRPMLDPILKILEEEKDPTMDYRIAGNPVILAYTEVYTDKMEILFPIALLVVGLLHFEAFRSKQGLILPLVTALLAVIWGVGVMGWAGIPLDIFNSGTPILILAIAAGHAVQLLKRYYEEYDRLSADGTLTPKEANQKAVIASVIGVGPVMVAAAAMAAIGFFSLVVFDLSTVRTFAIFTGVGVLSACLLELTLIPAMRACLPAPKRQQGPAKGFKFWTTIPEKIGRIAIGPNRKMVYIIAVAVLGLGVMGASMVKVDNSDKGYFWKSVPFLADDDFINHAFGGTDTTMILFDGGAADAIKDPVVLNDIANLQKYLETYPSVGKTVGITDYLRKMNKSMHNNDAQFDVVPASQDLVSQYLLLYALSGDPTDFDPYVDYTYRYGKLLILQRDDNAAYGNAFISDVQKFAKDNFKSKVTMNFAGSLPSAMALTEVMVKHKLLNIGQLAAAIFVMSLLLFRSLTCALFVMVPLVLTVIMDFAVMGFGGIPLNIPNSLQVAMAVGVGADYAVYLIYRFREEYAIDGRAEEAIMRTMRTAGKACLFVASAIAGGYAVLFFNFGYNIHNWFSILIVTAMLVSVFSSLFLIPSLLMSWHHLFTSDRANNGLAQAAKMALTAGLGLSLLFGSADQAQAADTETPESVMTKNLAVIKVIDSNNRATFRLVNGQGQERIRKVSGSTKLKPNGHDNMQLTRFDAPADVKGTAILLLENSAGDDDMWVYLPALKKVRRLVSSNKRESFLGTDLSYGDVIGHKVADWKHKFLPEESQDGVNCFVVESVPANAQVATDSGYSKRVSWIAKSNFTLIKGDFYNDTGKLFKQVHQSNIKLLDAERQKWRAMHVEASNLETQHKSFIDFSEFVANQNVKDDLFSARSLETE